MTIVPSRSGGVDERRGTRDRTMPTFAAGATVMGALTFALAALVGRVLGVGRGAALLVSVMALVFGVGHVVRHPLPVFSPTWQVPKLWREVFSPGVAAGLYGAGLGVGFMTAVPYATFYVALWCAALSTSVWTGLLVGAVFGLARAIPLMLLRRRRLTFDGVFEWSRTQAARPGVVEVVNGLALVAVACVLVSSLT